nr:YetF domain-containing protein [Paenibacillus polymyxa]
MKNQKLRSWFSGKPTVLIQDGKIMEGNMRKLKVTLDTLNQELRAKNFFNIQDVQYAVLELNGGISVLPKPDCMPVIRKDLHLKNQSEQAFPIELIMDGDVIDVNLQQNGITTEWLHSQIKKKGLSIEEINYAVISSNGDVYFDEYKDGIEHPIDKE